MVGMRALIPHHKPPVKRVIVRCLLRCSRCSGARVKVLESCRKVYQAELECGPAWEYRHEHDSPLNFCPFGLLRRMAAIRSEEHTSELQSRLHLVCRLLLEKKKNNTNSRNAEYTR